MSQPIYAVDDVFGVARDVPLNYSPRAAVDALFVENLGRQKHLVIHGGSKQGKTCLRKHCLNDDDYILVQCSNNWSRSDIHANILKRAGFELTISVNKTVTGKNKLVASFGAELLGVSLGLTGEKETERTRQEQTAPLELEVDDVNDVIAALKRIRFSKFIVLEDFHYLPTETQKDFSIGLKAFHEASQLCFVIVGVWLEENRLIVYNGDLTGRVISINADKWESEDLHAVVAEGAHLLNVEFDAEFIDKLIHESCESVAIIQEVCREVCRASGIYQTIPNKRLVGHTFNARSMVRTVIDQQAPRYLAFIRNFADGFQQTELQMYRWLLFPLLTASVSALEKGLLYGELLRSIQKRHPQRQALNAGNLTQALQSTASLQVKKGLKPLVIDYDETNKRLTVVDRGFLIWLSAQQENRAYLLQEAGLGAYTVEIAGI